MNIRATLALAAIASIVAISGSAHGQPAHYDPEVFEAPQARDGAREALWLLEEAQPKLDKVRALFVQGFEGQGPLQSVWEFAPAFLSPRNRQFDAATADLSLTLQRLAYIGGHAGYLVPSRFAADAGNAEVIRGIQADLIVSRAIYRKRLGR